MTATTEPRSGQGAPDTAVAAQAARAAELLQAYLIGHDDAVASLELRMDDHPGDSQTIVLPAPAVGLLGEVLAELANGNMVTVAPARSELTSQQAADLLNVSRPYLVGLLDDRAIPFRRVGNRRRVRLTDVLAYQHREEVHRQRLLDELTAEAEDLGLEY